LDFTSSDADSRICTGISSATFKELRSSVVEVLTLIETDKLLMDVDSRESIGISSATFPKLEVSVLVALTLVGTDHGAHGGRY
jgi:hypothetical protein